MKINIFRSRINIISKNKVTLKILEQLETNQSAYVCFSNVHTVITGIKNKELLAATNNALIACPDGMPIVWYCKLKGNRKVEKCSGPDIMKILIELSGSKYKHYFYGGTNDVLNDLRINLLDKYPDIKIVGMYSPPFRKLNENEKIHIINQINNAKPDFVWIGLGAPKQEIFMNDIYKHLNECILFGVGAAFDFLSGNIKRAPKWMQNFGLEWLYRLIKEPKRLFRRYFITNIKFIFLVFKEIIFSFFKRNDW